MHAENSISEEIRKLLATHRNKEIAEIVNCSQTYVSNIRYNSKLKTPKRGWGEFRHLLGVVTDEQIAEMKGIKKNSVTTYRIRNRIGGIKQSKEEILQNKFFLKLKDNAVMYVRCLYGIIDILSDVAIYEVKIDLDSNNLKTAIGQLIVYSLAYPDRKKVVVTNKVKVSTDVIKSANSLGIEIITFDV